MLYWFYRHLDINIFQYITFRAGVAFLLAFFFALFIMPKFIRWAKAKGASQPIYDLAPDSHQMKSKTPTMGGVVFVASTLIATILTIKLNNIYVVGGILSLTLFALIGIKDDFAKISTQKNSEGLSPRAKFILQIISSTLIIAILFYANHPTDLYIPFYKHSVSELSYFSAVFWLVIFLSTTNAVNLTDGLDGLATVPSVFTLATMALITYIVGNAVISAYLLLPNISGVGELVILASALIGSLLGFLWYNAHPAQVFMGDTGSLAIGGFLAYISIVCKSEILLILAGIVFVIETLSVIVQVLSFKLRNKRVFLMAPIHHHFEVKGWEENKIIVRFWIIAFLANLIALISLKVR
jgi:phospho-N-acetylmuramoyl-pentapeptide-transferase